MGKLNVTVLRYLTKDDFRVLTAVSCYKTKDNFKLLMSIYNSRWKWV